METSNTVSVNSLVKRLDKWMTDLMINTDNYLEKSEPNKVNTWMEDIISSTDNYLQGSEKPSPPPDKSSQKTSPKKTSKKKKKEKEPKIKLVKSPIPAKKIPENIIPVVNKLDTEIDLLHHIGSFFPNLKWVTDTSFIQLVMTAILNNYDHPFIYDIPYLGRYPNQIMNDTNGISIALYKGITGDTFPINYKVLGVQLRDLKDSNDIIIIPFYISQIDNTGKSFAVHSNLLIYKPKFNTVDHFEPHGSQFYGEFENFKTYNDYIHRCMTNLWEKQLTPYIGQTTYVSRDLVCQENEGLQVLSDQLLDSTEGGYCALWSFFMADFVLQNPTVSTADIINKVFDISKKNPKYVTQILKGYIVQAFDIVKKYIKELYPNLNKKERDAFEYIRQQIGASP